MADLNSLKKYFSPQKFLFILLALALICLSNIDSTQKGIYTFLLFIVYILYRVFLRQENRQIKILTASFLFAYFLYGMFFIPGAEKFIKEFYNASNARDYKTIYRDMATSRLRTNAQSFDHFVRKMEEMNNQLGLASKQSDDLWVLFLYPKGWEFFRMKYTTLRGKNKCSEHFVLMREFKKWWLDGYSADCGGHIYIRAGNW